MSRILNTKIVLHTLLRYPVIQCHSGFGGTRAVWGRGLDIAKEEEILGDLNASDGLGQIA